MELYGIYSNVEFLIHDPTQIILVLESGANSQFSQIVLLSFTI